MGRGLEALIDVFPNDQEISGALMVPVEAIDPNRSQPRKSVKDKDLSSLADSIRQIGLLEPLLVRRTESGRYELIAGERRWRAAVLAGLDRLPVMVREASPAEMLELALIENLHREDLNPMEEAESYQRLAEDFGRTQDEIARLSGRDRSTVANLIRLLGLPGPVQEDVRQGRLSTGHARALLALGDPNKMLVAREQVLAKGLTVRQTEALVKKLAQPPTRHRTSKADEAYYRSLAEHMTRTIGAKVRIFHRGRRRIEIAYNTAEELERLMKQFGLSPI